MNHHASVVFFAILIALTSACSGNGRYSTRELVDPTPEQRDAQSKLKTQVQKNAWCDIRPSGQLEKLLLVNDGSYSFETFGVKDKTSGLRSVIDSLPGTWTLTDTVITITNPKSNDLGFNATLSADGTKLNLPNTQMIPCTAQM